jgi:hypothetical protein
MARSRAERDALLTLRRISEAVIVVIHETPEGAPGGHLYAALMQYKSLDQFEAMMRALVEAKRVRRHGDLYFPAEPSR